MINSTPLSVATNSVNSRPQQTPQVGLYRFYNESPHAYLLRVKFLCDPALGRNEAILPDIEEAFTEFIDSRPSKRKFIQVCGNLVLTLSMLWDIMQYKSLKTW